MCDCEPHASCSVMADDYVLMRELGNTSVCVCQIVDQLQQAWMIPNEKDGFTHKHTCADYQKNILDGPSTKKDSSRVRLRVEWSSGNMTDVNVDLTGKLVHSSTFNRTIDSRNLM